MNYTCGIDWASDHHDISIVNERGMEVKALKIDDDLKGYDTLLKALRKYEGNIPIAIECKEHLLISFLIGEGYTVYSINPRSAERYKDRYNVGGTKTDPVDAFSLAEILRTDRHKHRALAHSSEEIRKLQLLCSQYDMLLKDKNVLECQVVEVLRRYYPLSLTLFLENTCKTLYRLVIEYPTAKELRVASYEELSEYLKKNRYPQVRYIMKVYKKIHQGEYHRVDVFDEVFSQTAVGLCRLLLTINEQVEQVRRRMNEIRKNHPLGVVFRSLPGGGEVMSAKLLALMGDNRELYEDSSEVQSYVGIAPIIKSSGKSYRVVFRRACNRVHRDTMTWFAFCSMPYCEWARAYYDRKRKEGKRHYEACRLLAFKWMRIIFKLWKNGETYQEIIHLGQLEKYQERRKKIA